MKSTNRSETDHNGNIYYWRHVTEMASVLLEVGLGLLLVAMWLMLR